MKINKKEQRVMFDVDKTLIVPPDDFTSDKAIKMDYYGHERFRVRNDWAIELLIAYKTRGYSIDVCSANGWRWAQEVVNKLELQEFVNEVGSKYIKYVDDTPAEKWMHRVPPEIEVK